MKYIIMADGKETRWGLHGGIHKWQIRINGEMLLERTVRLVAKFDPTAEIWITSHDKTLSVEGAVRYEPLNNRMEIDRFTWELIDRDMVFLYADSYYTEEAMETICSTPAEDLLFFGNGAKIFAVKVQAPELFREHITRVKNLFLEGKIAECKGWQVYQSFRNIPFGERRVAENYVVVEDETQDFNEPADLERYLSAKLKP